ncbi:MAG: hypothetical protein WBD22_09780 [Pyrinomonadaceae bacterium]
MINIPIETEEVVWQSKTAGESNEDSEKGKTLTAALRLSPIEAGKLTSLLENSGAGVPSDVGVVPWFPLELIAQAELSGDDTLKGTAYPAAILARAPYTQGHITHIELTDYFVVELSEK